MKSYSENFNNAGSNSVGQVDKINSIGKNDDMPRKSDPNSVTKKVVGGIVKTERYFDKNGEPYLDIDYTDHGNPKRHPIVPHEHSIDISNGEFYREPNGRKIKWR